MRKSGILMSMTSLPSPYGIGTMGRAAYEFVDFLHAAGQSYWQLLPLGPTGYGDSPYASFSTFAGNPYFIDLDRLAEEGLLDGSELRLMDWGDDGQWVDYGKIYAHRFPVLRRAFARGREKLSGQVAAFRRENGGWLEEYALFMALKDHFGMAGWTKWPEEAIRLHRPDAVERYRRELRDEVDFWVFLQFLFFRQWDALRAYARQKGVGFIGDVPIYVALDSADVWSDPGFFLLDGENLPREVAGVPPDDFTAEGQLWGNPLYDWDAMRADGYGWWIRRIEGARRLYDVIRLDHFRGFESYWAVPYGDATAKGGCWRPGPGMELVGVLRGWFPDLSFIAEDLGCVMPALERLLSESGLPGMKVLVFAFDPRGESDYLPHNCQKHSVCYIGTHDNETVRGWVSDERNRDQIRFAREYLAITAREGWCWGMIRAGMATASELFVMQMQDVLELPGWSRMNTPGTTAGNWQWRMAPDAIHTRLAGRLRQVTHTYRRI